MPVNKYTNYQFWSKVIGLVIIIATGLLAYQGLRETWFYPIDDALHLAGVVSGKYPIQHYRPGHFAFNQLLFLLFGQSAVAWHLSGLALHVLNGVLLSRIARGVGATGLAAALGGAAFVGLRAPMEAVGWISASSGLLSMSCVLLSAASWVSYLKSERGCGRTLRYCLSLGLVGSAMLFKEDCVVAGPLIVGLYCASSDRDSLFGWYSARRLMPFALAGAACMLLVFDPSKWADRPGVGTYEFSIALIPRALSNVGILLWPFSVLPSQQPAWALPIGLSVSAMVLLLARYSRPEARRLLILGLAMSMLGLLPCLPGPWPAVAASRCGYPGAIGIGLLVAGCCSIVGSADARWRSLAVYGSACLFVFVHTMSVSSAVEWKYRKPGAQFLALIEDSSAVVANEDGGTVLFIAPPVWNALDFAVAARVFATPKGMSGELVNMSLSDVDRDLESWSERAALFVWSGGQWAAFVGNDHSHGLLRLNAKVNEDHGMIGVVSAALWVRSDQ